MVDGGAVSGRECPPAPKSPSPSAPAPARPGLNPRRGAGYSVGRVWVPGSETRLNDAARLDARVPGPGA
jgi:hypothetical protein